MAYRTVLVVEDDRSLSSLLQGVLGAKGYDVYCADSGERALTMLGALDPGIMILDIGLPDLDGVEVCRRVRANAPKGMPIIFLTANEEPTTLIRAIDAGGDDYVLKTLGIEPILKRLDWWGNEGRGQDLVALRAERRARLVERQ